MHLQIQLKETATAGAVLLLLLLLIIIMGIQNYRSVQCGGYCNSLSGTTKKFQFSKLSYI